MNNIRKGMYEEFRKTKKNDTLRTGQNIKEKWKRNLKNLEIKI